MAINKLMGKNSPDLSKIMSVDINNLSKFMGFDITAGTGTPVFLDEFTGDNGDPPNPIYWINEPNNVSIQDNKLHFNNALLEVTSEFTITGDCDIQVDFDISHGSYQYNNMTLQLYDGATTEDSFIRAKWENSADWFESRIRHEGTFQAPVAVSRSNQYGGFRITHEGTTVTIYYKDGDGSWVQIDTGTFDPEVDYIVRLKMLRAGGVITGDYDNFQITTADTVTVDSVFYGDASGDDGHCIDGSITKDATTDALGLYSGDSYDPYLLFNDVNIPKDSTISQAYVSFKSYGSASGDTVNVDINLGDVDNAVEPDNCTEIANTDRTATVNWDSVGSWTNQLWYNTPELKTILQTVVNREGWVLGNTVAVFIEDDSSSSYRRFYALDHVTTANKPQLHVSWEM